MQMERSQDLIRKLLDTRIGLSHPTVYSRKLEDKVKAKAVKVDTQRRHSIAPGGTADAVSPFYPLKYLLMKHQRLRTSPPLSYGHSHLQKQARTNIDMIPAAPLLANGCFSAARN